ncbi:hypothetical protein [Flavivirga sp. 57AJ16]|uniref:hypothetical protein n=1 Tax=Flavivirga sp. 57AJ16 TaxID=3025307 RepID=UPI0023672E83|nr:hypothetical protein [Flavivirga sp. 57AJ16]MDD7885172.1 hypothetical protein [Flavivirga sp. 57AJ16]
MLGELAHKLIEKSYFPKVKSVDYELKKAGVLRILLGLIIFVRFYQIADDYNLYFGEYSWFGFINLVLIVFFTLGFSLPFVTTLLLFFVRFSDGFASTGTLGTTILIQTFFVFLLMNSGEYYSLDSIILKKKNIVSKFIKHQYSIIGKHNNASLTKLYFFAFFVYGLISFGAIVLHIQDNYWINGLTVKSLLSNSYLSSFFQEFRWVESNYSMFTSLFSIAGGIIQSVFQLLMIVLVFFKAGNFFVKWWGMKFFIISLFFINLSYLPHIEIIFWFLIFFPSKFTQENKFTQSVYKLSFVKNLRSQASVLPNKFNGGILGLFYSAYGLILVLFTLVFFPVISNYTSNILGSKRNIVRDLLYRSGLEIPAVFNNSDLSMGDCWMVIYRKKESTKENNWDLVPISAEDGRRITYYGHNVLGFSNHNSDFLYFGTSLAYRRKIINVKDYKRFHEKGFGHKSIIKRVKFDYQKKNLTETYFYKIIVYKNSSSKVIHWESNTERHNKKVVYTTKFKYNGSIFF